MNEREELQGKRFGKWFVVAWNKEKHKWLCKCDCGTEKFIETYTLKSGKSTRCHKCRNLYVGLQNSTHHKTHTRIYRIYRTMLARCYLKSNSKYRDYGERGISVCEEWKKSFVVFHDWAMLNGYADNLQIDRKNNNGNYEPSNCRWVTCKENANNTRKNHKITFKGITKNLCEWAVILNIKSATIRYRLKRGWTIDRALTEKPFVGKNQTYLEVGL